MNQNIAEEDTDTLYAEILRGLNKVPKSLPSKFFYDERGSKLFDKICLLDEYYPTRTEMDIISGNIEDIVEKIGQNVLLIELGSGSSKKIELLLDHLDHPAAYVPIDISGNYLYHSVARLENRYPDLRITPVVADYTRPFELPDFDCTFDHKTVFFPGSTIGNFKPEKAVSFLKLCADLAYPNGNMLIGVDLIKNTDILEAAYNDSEGITAAFNSNILLHINSITNADFDPDKFEHRAFFNKKESRIEMHLDCKENHTVHLGGRAIIFQKGESIHTENSYKYSLEKFENIANRAGFEVSKVWTDPNDYFSLQLLTKA